MRWCSRGLRVSYRVLDERVNRLANALLATGLAQGQTIGVFAENTHKYLEAYLAASKAGLVVTPLNFRLSDAELIHIINDAEMRLLLVGDTYLDVAKRIRTELPAVSTYVALDGASTETCTTTSGCSLTLRPPIPAPTWARTISPC